MTRTPEQAEDRLHSPPKTENGQIWGLVALEVSDIAAQHTQTFLRHVPSSFRPNGER